MVRERTRNRGSNDILKIVSYYSTIVRCLCLALVALLNQIPLYQLELEMLVPLVALPLVMEGCNLGLDIVILVMKLEQRKRIHLANEL